MTVKHKLKVAISITLLIILCVSIILNYILAKSAIEYSVKNARMKAEVLNFQWLIEKSLDESFAHMHFEGVTNDYIYGPGTQAPVFLLVQKFIATNTNNLNSFPNDRIIDGEYVDAWHQPFRIAVDHDGNGVLTTKEFGVITNEKVIVWSTGGNPISSLK